MENVKPTRAEEKDTSKLTVPAAFCKNPRSTPSSSWLCSEFHYPRPQRDLIQRLEGYSPLVFRLNTDRKEFLTFGRQLTLSHMLLCPLSIGMTHRVVEAFEPAVLSAVHVLAGFEHILLQWIKTHAMPVVVIGRNRRAELADKFRMFERCASADMSLEALSSGEL